MFLALLQCANTRVPPVAANVADDTPLSTEKEFTCDHNFGHVSSSEATNCTETHTLPNVHLRPKDDSALLVKPVHFSQSHTKTPEQVARGLGLNFPATKRLKYTQTHHVGNSKSMLMERHLMPFKKWKVKWRQCTRVGSSRLRQAVLNAR